MTKLNPALIIFKKAYKFVLYIMVNTVYNLRVSSMNWDLLI